MKTAQLQISKLEKLAKQWSLKAIKLHKRCDKIWTDLENGVLPQIDSIIYSAYEKAERAFTLEECAEEIRKVLK